MRSQMQAMFTYIQSTGAPPPPPDLFPGLAGGVPPPGGVLPPGGVPPPSGASPAGTPLAFHGLLLVVVEHLYLNYVDTSYLNYVTLYVDLR
ncbi:hypothetical protein EJB05_50663 [Eragrostis curvula]|uniref:Uncharacterized protein n=1 Tax=Eragrostis curvula TaxID=38414 RepID=A0A5J9SXP5_9POAL|nr:hypothetical protein EJB05_50663 [Eragrostis curvula]